MNFKVEGPCYLCGQWFEGMTIFTFIVDYFKEACPVHLTCALKREGLIEND